MFGKLWETEIKTEETEQKCGWGRLRNGRPDAWYWDREWERPEMSAAIFYYLDRLTFLLKGRDIDLVSKRCGNKKHPETQARPHTCL